MEPKTDNRQANHIQVYRSEALTLARTAGMRPFPENATRYAMARIRLIKSDLRLPTMVFVAFDPDGGNPDKASISSAGYQLPNPALKASVSELILAKRAYVPILKLVGSGIDVGYVDVPNRPGALGFAWRVSDECDAIDLNVQLPHAVGEMRGEGDYWHGRWITGYSFTTNERLSREEWAKAASETNISIEVRDELNLISGCLNIVKEFPG